MISLSNSEHWLIERAKLSGEDKWIILNEKEFTFMAIQKLSNQAASYFHKLGINKDDHVAILSENNVEFIISVFALWLLGAVPIPINTRSKDEELKSLIEISHSKYLVEVCDKSSSKPLSNIKTIKFTLENICDFNQYNELFPFQPNNTALMLFTSGSSGIPKCVPLTFENLFFSAMSSNEFIKHNKDDLWLASLPFYHIGGFSIITRSFLFGCSLVIPRSIKIFDIIETVEKFSPSLLSVVPTMLNKLIEKEVKPWQELRIMFLGGGPTSEKLINRAIKNMFPIVLVYGSTETSSMVTFCSVENLLKNGISSGKPFDGVEIEIMVNKNLSSEDKNIGCIAVKSGSVAQAYYNNFIEDKESFKNGKFFTNDLGYIDKNGNLNIIGRMDEIIISGGENISLLEIRKLLLRKIVKHNFEVIGVKDNKWDQSYIIIVETTDLEVEKEIDTLLRSKLASYKLPQNIYCINKIPRNEMGKIQKEKLKLTVKVDFL